MSAAGSGELLFTPRVGALYGYALVWAMIAAVLLKWFINREIGRFAVCTGATVLDGFKNLPGPRSWTVWLIIVPPLVVAVATMAGLAAASATALVLVLPGDVRIWMMASLLSATALVLWGRYKTVEWTALGLGRARRRGDGGADQRKSDRPIRPLELGSEDRKRLRGWVTQKIGLYSLIGNPVGLLKLAGAIEAAHIPIVASRAVFAATSIAGLFFAAFAGIYAFQLLAA